ncbi:UNVERIFIED_CONTAM: hypothetical protein FKN15_004259 [Acipenser sinensis]
MPFCFFCTAKYSGNNLQYHDGSSKHLGRCSDHKAGGNDLSGLQMTGLKIWNNLSPVSHWIEMCDPGNRFMVTMVASFIALLGQLLLPGLAALCRDWQILQAVIICPFILMISFICIFPESLRWLLATQQYEKAKSLILQISKKNRVDSETDVKGIVPELERELTKKPKKTCIVKVVGTRNLWKNILVLCVNSLTGFGIHHCFARSMMKNKWENTTVSHNSDIHNMMLSNFYADYYTMAGIAVASCLAMCPAVGFMGRRGGLLMFMILTALASLLQLGFLNCESLLLGQGLGWVWVEAPKMNRQPKCQFEQMLLYPCCNLAHDVSQSTEIWLNQINRNVPCRSETFTLAWLFCYFVHLRTTNMHFVLLDPGKSVSTHIQDPGRRASCNGLKKYLDIDCRCSPA